MVISFHSERAINGRSRPIGDVKRRELTAALRTKRPLLRQWADQGLKAAGARPARRRSAAGSSRDSRATPRRWHQRTAGRCRRCRRCAYGRGRWLVSASPVDRSHGDGRHCPGVDRWFCEAVPVCADVAQDGAARLSVIDLVLARRALSLPSWGVPAADHVLRRSERTGSGVPGASRSVIAFMAPIAALANAVPISASLRKAQVLQGGVMTPLPSQTKRLSRSGRWVSFLQ